MSNRNSPWQTPAEAPQTATSDPDVQFTIRCPQSVLDRFKALCFDPETKARFKYADKFEQLIAEYEKGRGQ